MSLSFQFNDIGPPGPEGPPGPRGYNLHNLIEIKQDVSF